MQLLLLYSIYFYPLEKFDYEMPTFQLQIRFTHAWNDKALFLTKLWIVVPVSATEITGRI